MMAPVRDVVSMVMLIPGMIVKGKIETRVVGVDEGSPGCIQDWWVVAYLLDSLTDQFPVLPDPFGDAPTIFRRI